MTRPSTFLAISSIGVHDLRAPALVAWAWGITGAPVFVPQVRKKLLGSRRWAMMREKFPVITREIRELAAKMGGIDMILLDVGAGRRIDNVSLVLAHYIAGVARCPRIKFITYRRWASVLFGPEAALEDDGEAFDRKVVLAISNLFPSTRTVVTCAQPARAAALLYWGAARYGGRIE